MLRFAAYVRDRDARLAEDLGDGFIPFGVTRPSSKIPSCKDYTKRLVRSLVGSAVLVVAAIAADPLPPVLLKGHKGTLSCLAFSPDGKDGIVIV